MFEKLLKYIMCRCIIIIFGNVWPGFWWRPCCLVCCPRPHWPCSPACSPDHAQQSGPPAPPGSAPSQAPGWTLAHWHRYSWSFVGNHLLPVEVLTGSFCINFRLINISHCLLQTRAILLYPRAVPIFPHVWLLKVTLLMKEIDSYI